MTVLSFLLSGNPAYTDCTCKRVAIETNREKVESDAGDGGLVRGLNQYTSSLVTSATAKSRDILQLFWQQMMWS